MPSLFFPSRIQNSLRTCFACFLALWASTSPGPVLAQDLTASEISDRAPSTPDFGQDLVEFHRELTQLAQRRTLDEASPSLDRQIGGLLLRIETYGARIQDLKGTTPSIEEQKFIRLLSLAKDLADGVAVPAMEEPWPASVKVGASCASAPSLGVGERAASSLRADAGWVRFRAPRAGLFRADTAGSLGDTRVTVYDSCPPTVPVAEGDDAYGLLAATPFAAEAGQGFWIHASGTDPVKIGLESTGAVSGQVLDTAGQPVEGRLVDFRRPSGVSSGSVSTAVDGTFIFPVDPGTYTAFVNPTFDSPYLGSAYDGVTCEGACRFADATPFDVADGVTVSGINFVLVEGAAITGRAKTDGGLPLDDAVVYLYDAFGNRLETTYTDVAGRYRFDGLFGRDYRLTIRHPETIDAVWPDHSCHSGDCNPLAGETVFVPSEQVVSGIDFDLALLGSIEFEVRDALTGDPVFVNRLEIYDENGLQVSSSSGHILRVGGLASGTYFAKASDTAYLSQLWEDIPCPEGCDPTTGTPVEVVEGETARLEMELTPNGRVSGRVTAADAGGGLELGWVRVTSVDGSFWRSSFVFGNGEYAVVGLPPGRYQAYATVWDFFPLAWDGVPCPAAGCSAVGDEIEVLPGVEVEDVDFALVRRAVVEGTVREAGTGSPVEGATLYLHPEDGSSASIEYSDADGHYRFVSLEAGTYFLVASSEAHLDELWLDLPCEDQACDPATGTPIPALDGTVVTADFELDRQPFLTGVVTEEGDDRPLRDISVVLYDGQGEFLDRSSTDADGRYQFDDLEVGNYFLLASGYDRHIPVLFGGVSCFGGVPNGCVPTDGTPVAVTSSGGVADFDLPVGGEITGFVQETGGDTTFNTTVQVYDGEGRLAGSDYSDDGVYRILGLEEGAYFAVTTAPLHFNRVWDDRPCELETCDPTTGTPIPVARGELISGIDFVLPGRGWIFGRVLDATTGEPVSPAGVVQLYDAAGLPVATDSQSSFSFRELDEGVYYLATRGHDRHQDRVFGVGGELCEPGSCDPLSGTPLVVQSDGVINVDIVLDPGPGFSIEVRDQTGAPVAFAAIDIWDTDGDWRSVATAGADGRVQVPMFAGTYYLSTDNGEGLVDQVWEGVECPAGSVFSGLCDTFQGTPVTLLESQPVTEILFTLRPPQIFADGFESGDTSRWSNTQVP
ncbi:MAG: carboxypeptidase regulatory-like domain-containing protein [Acidobacteriota bacterium]